MGLGRSSAGEKSGPPTSMVIFSVVFNCWGYFTSGIIGASQGFLIDFLDSCSSFTSFGHLITLHSNVALTSFLES